MSAEPADELTTICKLHRRKCMLHAAKGYPVRLMHMSRIGTPAEFCGSALFIMRHEYEASRETVFAQLESRDEKAAAAELGT